MKSSSFDSAAVCFFNFIQIQNLRQTENVCMKSLLWQEAAGLYVSVCSVILNGVEPIYVILDTSHLALALTSVPLLLQSRKYFVVCKTNSPKPCLHSQHCMLGLEQASCNRLPRPEIDSLEVLKNMWHLRRWLMVNTGTGMVLG